jgi:hypothetical protein
MRTQDGCINDVEAMKKYLIDRGLFTNDEITIQIGKDGASLVAESDDKHYMHVSATK